MCAGCAFKAAEEGFWDSCEDWCLAVKTVVHTILGAVIRSSACEPSDLLAGATWAISYRRIIFWRNLGEIENEKPVLSAETFCGGQNQASSTAMTKAEF